MDTNKKAVANLERKDIVASIQNDTVYVIIGDTYLELSQFEIDFQAKEWDEAKLEKETEN